MKLKLKDKITEFHLINIEYNRWNGMMIEICSVNGYSLIGLHFGFKHYCNIDLFFKTYEIWKN